MATNNATALEQVRQELRRRAAQKTYYDYVKYTNPGYLDTKFHKFLCTKIEDFLNTNNNAAFDVLLISTPPQHGKSVTITETLPSYYLGKNPSKNVIIAGYSEDFAKRFGRRNLKKLELYGGDLFGFKPAEAPWTNTEFESDEGGRCISRGILSGITGNPANLVLIDDPTKNMQEALSETTRAAILDEFYASIITRIAPHGKLIIIMTRWHEDDLFGHVLANFPNATVLNLPCEAEENDPMGRMPGDPLCPEIGKGASWLKDFKSVYCSENGLRSWNALYQGHPSINSGNLFLEKNWKYYNPEDLPSIGYRALSVDCTFKKSETSDFVAIQDWAKSNNDYYLIKRTKRRLSFSETLMIIRDYLSRSDYDAVYIEDKANGSAVIDMLRTEFDNIIAINPEGGKLSRAAAVSYLQETGHVHLPNDDPSIDEFVDEHTKFPGGAHDDEVDACTQALNRLVMINGERNNTFVQYTKWTEDMWEDYNNANPMLQNELLHLWGQPEEWKPDVA